jgi:PAS domain S-box-containing protein
MRGLFQRVRGVDVAAGLYAAAFFAWLALRTPGTPSTRLIGVVAFYPLGLAVVWANWQNSRLPGLDARTRAAWRLLSLSALALYASGTAWNIFLSVFGTEGWPGWVDHLELAHNIVAIVAILAFPRRKFTGRGRTRFLLDAGLMVTASLVLAVYFGARLWLHELQGESLWTAINGPGFDLAFFSVAAIGAVQKRDRGSRVALIGLVLAGVAYLAANYVFTIAEYGHTGAGYVPGDAVDGLWFLAWVLRWSAARVARDRYEHDRAVPPKADAPGWIGYERSGFPYLVVGGTFIVLTRQTLTLTPGTLRGDTEFAGMLVVSAAVMVALLLARQLVELRENERLFAAQVEQDARFRSFVQRSSDVVLVVDPEGTVSYASPSAARVLGEHSVARPGASLPAVVREDDRPALAQILAGAAPPRRLQLHLPAEGGAWRDIEALWSDLRADPSVNGFVVNCRDVTERNELQRQLRHNQKLDAVSRLAGGLAHDLNNVLSIIGGYADLLKTATDPASAAADDLTHIQQAVDRAATVTRKVLAFSRRQPVLRGVLDLNALIADLLPMLRQSVRAKVEVRLRLEDGLWPVRADRGQMEQVLVNLATNARDAMPDGGVLEIATANRPAAASLSPGLPRGDSVAVTVTDTGTGMTREVRERIFEPFFSTKGASGGMGLGLAMVNGIVADSGGRVFVESEAGRGSAFTILLPKTDAAVAQADRPGETLERPGRLLTVLVVDDEENVRTVARRILEGHGYQVVEASSGHQALDVIANPSIALDLVLTDLVMPGVNGRQLIARCEELRPTLPVVCMTGFAGDGDDPRQYGKNLVALVPKPFTSALLRRVVAAAVDFRSAT